MCDPEIAGRNADAIGYATPVDGAKEYMDETWANSPVVYPSAEVLENGRTFNSLSNEANQYMDKLWTDLKVMVGSSSETDSDGASSDKYDYMRLVFAVGGAAVGALVTWFFLRREYKKRLYDDSSLRKGK